MSQARDQLMWMFALAAIVVGVVAITIAQEHYADVHSWARLPSWLANPVLLALLLFVSLVLAAYATVGAYRRGNSTWRIVVPALFVGIAVIFLVTVYLIYRVHNFLAAFYLSIVVFLLALVHAYGVSLACRGNYCDVLAMVPLLVVAAVMVFLLWYMADESSDCLAVATPVYAAA